MPTEQKVKRKVFVTCVCAKNVDKRYLSSHTCTEISDILQNLNLTKPSLYHMHDKKTNVVFNTKQVQINFEEVEESLTLMKNENREVQKLGFALYLMTKFLFRHNKDTEISNDIWSLTMENFTFVNDSLTLQMVYGSAAQQISYKLS